MQFNQIIEVSTEMTGSGNRPTDAVQPTVMRLIGACT